MKIWRILPGLAFVVSVLFIPAFAQDGQETTEVIDNPSSGPEHDDFVHTPEGLDLLEPIALLPEVNYSHYERRDFYLTGFLETNYPHLLKFRDDIGHWSGYHHVYPVALLSLIELETEFDSLGSGETAEQTDTLGRLSSLETFAEQIKDVSYKIARLRSGEIEKPAIPSDTYNTEFLDKFSSIADKPTVSPDGISMDATDSVNLPEGGGGSAGSGTCNAGAATGSPPPYGLLQLPYLRGISWRFGGSHHNCGGTYTSRPYAALDFSRFVNDGWGSDTSNLWAAAAHAGKVSVYSSCSLEIFGPPGFSEWSTTYYHLDNIQIQDKELVDQNVKLANYANNLAQATCDDGGSSGAHLHFNLFHCCPAN